MPKIGTAKVAALILRLAFSFPLLTHASSDADTPTASERPKTIDKVWQAANSKYGSERDATLKRVNAVIEQGPFRADWAIVATI